MGKDGRVIGACSGSIRNTLTRSNDSPMFLVTNPLYIYLGGAHTHSAPSNKGNRKFCPATGK